MTGIGAMRLRKRYGSKEVLRGVDLAIPEGESFALLGPSGSGKTTLLRLLAGLETPDAGTVRLGDGTVTLGEGVGLVMQRPAVFRRSVFDNVAYGLHLRGDPETSVAGRVAEALGEVGLDGREEDRAWTLSAGEAQRLCFARSAVLRPKVLLLDEFTANLDPANVSALESALGRYHEETGATILIVTHNLFQARRVATRAGLLLDGVLVESGPVDSLLTAPSDERTRQFVSGETPF